MDYTDAARDSRRDANITAAKALAKKIATKGARLTAKDRHVASLLISGITEALAVKAAKRSTATALEIALSDIDIVFDVHVSYLRGEHDYDIGGVL